MIINPLVGKFQKIVMLDKRVAYGNKNVKSHPIAIYLNKSALCSKPPAKVIKSLIYQRMASSPTLNEMDTWNMCTSYTKKTILLGEQDVLRQALDDMKIEPRRDDGPNSTITILGSTLLKNYYRTSCLTKPQNFENSLPVVRPVKPQNVDCLLRKPKTISRHLLYRRCQLKSPHEEGYFPLAWDRTRFIKCR